MSFHNVRLPEFMAVFAVGVVEFSTSCVQTASGRELRNPDRLNANHKYLLKNCRLNTAQFTCFNNFFRARCGQNHAFRFRDMADYQVTEQVIATGDGITQEFCLYKSYDDVIKSYRRRIAKPVEGSVTVYIKEADNLIETKADINHEHGIINLITPLPVGQLLLADFAFDNIVRFSGDRLEYSYSNDGSIELAPLELLEVIN